MSRKGEGQKRKATNLQEIPKQVKQVEDWGGGGSIACSKDKRGSYRRSFQRDNEFEAK